MTYLNCNGCLASNRKLNPLKPQATDIFTMLCPDMCLHISRYLLCWECEFMIDKIKLFEARVRKANNILKLYMEGKVAIVEELSRLKQTGIESISFAPQNTHPLLKTILQQSTPIVPQNTPTLQQNTPTLQQHLLQRNTPPLLPKSPTLREKTPTLVQNTSTAQQNIITLPQKNKHTLQQNTPVLQQNTPILFQNMLIQQENTPTLIQNKLSEEQNTPLPKLHTPIKQDTPTILQNTLLEQLNTPLPLLHTPIIEQNTPSFLQNTFSEEQNTLLPKLHTPIIELKTPILLQNTPIQHTPTLPKTERPFRLLKDMLSAPLKLETTVKVENDRSLSDYDDTSQPATILIVSDDDEQSHEESLKDEPTEFEEDEITVKDEPIIRNHYTSVNASTEQLTLREELVTVTDSISNAVTTVEETSNVVTEEIAPSETKDQVCELNLEKLLAKLLTAPSKSNTLLSRPSGSKEIENLQNTELGTEDEMKCVTLSKSQLDAIRQKKRQHLGYLKAAYKCEKCIQSYPSQEKFNAHRKKHDESQGPAVCEICKLRFADDNLRDEHYKQHFIAYCCLQCPYQSTSMLKFTKHMRETHEESCFYCRKCSTTFKTFKERHIHNIQVHDIKIRCEECRQPFASSMLALHMANAHRKSHCLVCKKNFSRSYLKYHMRKVHDKTQDVIQEDIICEDCGISYKSKRSYQRHLKTSLKHNPIEKFSIKCEHCDKLFPTKQALQIHVEEIIGVKYTCDYCKKDKKSKNILLKHIRAVHEGKPRKYNLVCEICGKSYADKRHLAAHVNKHFGRKPHVCPECGKRFLHETGMHYHRRTKHKVVKINENDV